MRSLPHGAFKDFWGDSEEWNGLVSSHLRLEKVSKEHFFEHVASGSENHLVALEFLMEQIKFFNFAHTFTYKIYYVVTIFLQFCNSFFVSVIFLPSSLHLSHW